jgi:SAM-dependent methyltransferase
VGLEEGRLERPPRDWYLPLAEHLGEAYFRYYFTQGTEQEADFLYDALCLTQGCRLLDVGAGPGRHAIELAGRGIQVVGVDSSSKFLNIARRRADDAGVEASFFEMDAYELPFEDEFDAVISICEGAFGLGLEDLKILKGMARALKPGGHAAVASANVYHLFNGAHSGVFDPVSALFKQTIEEVYGEDGSAETFEMWNSCYTPRELEWIANGAGLDPQFVSGVAPGRFRGQAPTFAHPELLLLARRPS